MPRRAVGARMSSATEETQLECEGSVTHLQNATEVKDTALSHELHDDLGGLMGAAVMDLEAVRCVKPALSQNALNRVDRVKRTLEQAIDLKRRVIEDWRPSILAAEHIGGRAYWTISACSRHFGGSSRKLGAIR